MPTVLRERGFVFSFYSDEGNEPAHVHVKKGSGRGKWWLEPTLAEEYAYGFTLQERRRIKELVSQHYDHLKQQWYEYFQ